MEDFDVFEWDNSYKRRNFEGHPPEMKDFHEKIACRTRDQGPQRGHPRSQQLQRHDHSTAAISGLVQRRSLMDLGEGAGAPTDFIVIHWDFI